MSRESRPNEACQKIDEETVELFVMGRLQNELLVDHLKICDFCRARAAEHRSWIEDLKRGLQDFKQAEITSPPDEDAGQESKPDGS